ncbi:MAG: hypothetical protein WC569_05515 [Candidatus Omnitrophota bacterium]
MKKIKTSSGGRRCKFPGCRQILSIYNHESFCFVHLRQPDWIRDPKAEEALC